jgi:hypothetical protein
MPVNDPGVRSLIDLQSSASTARVLDLLTIWRDHKSDPEYSKNPFFHNLRLNRAIIVKHKLRSNEADFFDDTRMVATKILVALDPGHLKAGGQFVFIGQSDFAKALEELAGQDSSHLESHDIPLLKLVDELLSLDPFRLRERLKARGFKPANCYFQLSPADRETMADFVYSEIEPLMRQAGGQGKEEHGRIAGQVEKILTHKIDSELEPLRTKIGVSPDAFGESIFCWSGILYYKWVYSMVRSDVPNVTSTLEKLRPVGSMEPTKMTELRRMAIGVARNMKASVTQVKSVFENYDKALSGLIKNSDAAAFREFLSEAPAMFDLLGAHLGVLQSICGICHFRFPENRPMPATFDELFDIYSDFEAQFTKSLAA